MLGIGPTVVSAFRIIVYDHTGPTVPLLNPLWQTASAAQNRKRAFSAKPYLDSRGILTIGFGTNIGKKGSPARKRSTFYASAWRNVPNPHQEVTVAVSGSSERQQSAILDMGYQIGAQGVLGFHMLRGCLARGAHASYGG